MTSNKLVVRALFNVNGVEIVHLLTNPPVVAEMKSINSDVLNDILGAVFLIRTGSRNSDLTLVAFKNCNSAT